MHRSKQRQKIASEKNTYELRLTVVEDLENLQTPQKGTRARIAQKRGIALCDDV